MTLVCPSICACLHAPQILCLQLLLHLWSLQDLLPWYEEMLSSWDFLSNQFWLRYCSFQLRISICKARVCNSFSTFCQQIFMNCRFSCYDMKMGICLWTFNPAFFWWSYCWYDLKFPFTNLVFTTPPISFTGFFWNSAWFLAIIWRLHMIWGFGFDLLMTEL